MLKNVVSQKLAVYAWNMITNAPETGDQGNITAQISKDGAATAATDDANPTELDATDAPGIYLFDMLQAETNADLIIVSPVSSTAGVILEPVIIYTVLADLSAILADTNEVQSKLPTNKFMGSSDGADDDGTLNTIAGDVVNIDGAAMRGTDGANTTVPDVAGTAAGLHGTTDGKVDAVQSDATAIKNKTDGLNFTGNDVKATLNGEEVTTDAASRTASKAGAAEVAGAEVDVTEIHGSALTETAGGRLAAAFVKLFDVVTPLLVASDVMRGTDGANTTVPDAAGTAPTAVEIQAEMEENGASILDTIRDLLVNGGTIDQLLDDIKERTDNLPDDPADDSDIDAQLATIAGYLTTEIVDMLKLLRADKFIDITADPWETIYREEGTEDALMTKTMKNTAGDDITNRNNVLGQLTQA